MNFEDIWRATVGSYAPGGSRKPQVVRQATFPPCHHCGGRAYSAKEPAESIISANWRFVRQRFECEGCGHQRRLVRRLDRDWTGTLFLARAGIQA